MRLSAKLAHVGAAAPAVEALVAAGCERSAIEIYSNEPVELPPGSLDRPSRMSLYAVLGAIINGTAATAFMFWTQQDYPLPTGGMPLISGWATAVVSFEMAMAGAIAGTLIGLLWEAKLVWRTPEGPPQVLDGDAIIIEAPVEEAVRERAAAFLHEAGAVKIAWREERQ